ncbi:MAG TPA: helix-turn-helix transcriptional regulator [Pseudonocardia sp.]|nr:helix-turn-helix transcriptional regulator [Pseudonocardia sp.]
MLRGADYQRVFGVLERCDEASSVPDFAERLLAALAGEFELRHTTFFSGATFRAAFGDASPVLNGRTPAMFPEYREDWSDRDAFATPEPWQLLRTTHVASLWELRSLAEHGYFQDFLFKYGMYSATGLWLRLPGDRHAMVGLFDPDPGAVGERELATLRLLARQLNVISRALPAPPVEPDGRRALLAGVSDRQREVAGLVAEGLTNAAIGRRLALAEDTVKKYVSRTLAATGCRSRTELALLVGSSGRPAPLSRDVAR